MQEWYYVRNGQQSGPVSLEQLRELAATGGLNANDLVWNSSMTDWKPAGQVSGIFSPTGAPGMSADGSPQAGEPLAEITPGSEAIDPMACFMRGFELTKRHFATVALVGVVYVSIIIVLNLGIAGLRIMAHTPTTLDQNTIHHFNSQQATIYAITEIIAWVVGVYLGLGITRVGLNLVSGQLANINQLFGEGDKLIRAMIASILYMLMVGLGLILFIFPGIYLALRYGQFMKAIVDRDLGIMDSFNYSSSITTNNLANIFVYGLLAFAALIAGLLALCVGYFFAIPVVWLGGMVVYRCLQYGSRALRD